MSGRRYVAAEWVAFFAEPGEPSKALLQMAARFERACAAAWAAYPGTRGEDCNTPDGDGDRPSDPARLAYLTYASAVGHGIGLWEDDRGLVPEGQERELEQWMLGYTPPGRVDYAGNRPTIQRLANRLDEEIHYCEARGLYRQYRADGLSPADARARVAG